MVFPSLNPSFLPPYNSRSVVEIKLLHRDGKMTEPGRSLTRPDLNGGGSLDKGYGLYNKTEAALGFV